LVLLPQLVGGLRLQVEAHHLQEALVLAVEIMLPLVHQEFLAKATLAVIMATQGPHITIVVEAVVLALLG
jgi:hypothetical protein